MDANKKKDIQILKSNKGFATFESILMLFIMVTLMAFTLGSFGTVHTGIINSMSSRAYLFEIMDHRADINYLRSHPFADETTDPFRAVGYRFVGVSSDLKQGQEGNFREPLFSSTGRNVDFRKRDEANSSGQFDAHSKIQSLKLNERVSTEVDNVWVKTAYGICLTASCGGE